MKKDYTLSSPNECFVTNKRRYKVSDTTLLWPHTDNNAKSYSAGHSKTQSQTKNQLADEPKRLAD